MGKKYVVRLSEEEREQLRSLVKKGTVKAYRVKHANILLKADANGPGWTDQRIAEAFGCHFNTVVYVRQRLVEEGLERALGRKKQQRPSRARLLDGEQEAQLIALSFVFRVPRLFTLLIALPRIVEEQPQQLIAETRRCCLEHHSWENQHIKAPTFSRSTNLKPATFNFRLLTSTVETEDVRVNVPCRLEASCRMTRGRSIFQVLTSCF